MINDIDKNGITNILRAPRIKSTNTSNLLKDIFKEEQDETVEEEENTEESKEEIEEEIDSVEENHNEKSNEHSEVNNEHSEVNNEHSKVNNEHSEEEEEVNDKDVDDFVKCVIEKVSTDNIQQQITSSDKIMNHVQTVNELPKPTSAVATKALLNVAEAHNYNELVKKFYLVTTLLENALEVTVAKRYPVLSLKGYTVQLRQSHKELVDIISEMDPLAFVPDSFRSPFIKLIIILLTPVFFIILGNVISGKRSNSESQSFVSETNDQPRKDSNIQEKKPENISHSPRNSGKTNNRSNIFKTGTHFGRGKKNLF